MTKYQISDLLNELKSNEVYIRNDVIKKIIKEKINDDQIVIALKEIIENDPSMSVRNFARAALDIFGVEHSVVEEPTIEMRKVDVNAESNNQEQQYSEENQNVTSLGSVYGKIILGILVVAGILIFLDSFSWKNGGMNGLMSMIIGFLAIGAIIIVSIAFSVGKGAQYFLDKSEDSAQKNGSLPTQSIQAEINTPEDIVDMTAAQSKQRKNIPWIIVGAVITIGCIVFLALPTILFYLEPVSKLEP